MTVVEHRTTGRSLIPPPLFDRLAQRVVIEDDVAPVLAERIVDQALAFLAACALDHDEPLSPSPLVDLGWHAFVLHTRDYAAFCHQVAGRFVHHTPTEPTDPTSTGPAARARLARTVAAIEAAGFAVDLQLWPADAAADCTGCHNGCHDDPPPALA